MADSPAFACFAAYNEERTIAAAVSSARACPGIDRILVVVNGSTDDTARLARSAGTGDGAAVSVAETEMPLGLDAGRAVAAKWAIEEGAGVLLFLDADFPVRPRDLAPFIQAVRAGVDVACNNLSPLLEGWVGTGPATSVRRALNVFLGRPEMGLDGLVATPHALSRKAIETVGPETLAVPPVAYARAVMAGLEVRSVHTVNVIAPNRPDASRPRFLDLRQMAELIVGDHLEAVGEVIAGKGARGGFSDFGRCRPRPAQASAGLPDLARGRAGPA